MAGIAKGQPELAVLQFVDKAKSRSVCAPAFCIFCAQQPRQVAICRETHLPITSASGSLTDIPRKIRGNRAPAICPLLLYTINHHMSTFSVFLHKIPCPPRHFSSIIDRVWYNGIVTSSIPGNRKGGEVPCFSLR